MKLCPQCEFIYEDDQSACDMDGAALVFDTRVGIFPETSTVVAGEQPPASRVRSIALPAAAGLLLSALLFLAYCASTPSLHSKVVVPVQRTETPPPVAMNNPATQPGNPAESPDNSRTGSESAQPSPIERTDKPATDSQKSQPSTSKTKSNQAQPVNPLAVPPLPRITPLPQLPPPKRLPKAQSNLKSSGSNQKAVVVNVEPPPSKASKRAKVGGFLKKTADLLKKPFKF